jgi:hypothetical protein
VTEIKKPISIFYSWQSDLSEDTNRSAISQAIHLTIVTLHDEFKGMKLFIDDATRDLSGSPNIPLAIFEKISKADIFVCDITTITKANASRPLANPNVLIELGFAVSQLGWARIVLLFNKHFGNFPADVPFDVDRQRIADYLVREQSDSSGKGQLRNLLTVAIRYILNRDPPRGYFSSNEMIRRNRDIRVLNELLANIHLPFFDKFLEDAPQQLDTRIIHFWSGFSAYLESSQFHVHDPKLGAHIEKIKILWEEVLSYDEHYRDSGREYVVVFGMTPKEWPKPKSTKENYQAEAAYARLKSKESKDFPKLEKAVSDLRLESKAFFRYIQEEYLEVDLQETSQRAFADYKSYHE